MTTHPMSVRKFMKHKNLFRHDFFENLNELSKIEDLLSTQGFVNVHVNKTRPRIIVNGQMIPFTVAQNEMYQWCHKQLGSKNWVKVQSYLWFTNDFYRAMFVMTWLEH